MIGWCWWCMMFPRSHRTNRDRVPAVPLGIRSAENELHPGRVESISNFKTNTLSCQFQNLPAQAPANPSKSLGSVWLRYHEPLSTWTVQSNRSWNRWRFRSGTISAALRQCWVCWSLRSSPDKHTARTGTESKIINKLSLEKTFHFNQKSGLLLRYFCQSLVFVLHPVLHRGKTDRVSSTEAELK